MNWDAIAAIGEILGLGTLFVTLGYLVLHVRQSDRAQRASSLQSVLDGYLDRTFLPGITHGDVADIWARGLMSLDLLDVNEKRWFWFIMLNEFLHTQHVLKLRELRMIEPVDYDAWLSYTTSLVKTPSVAVLWPVVKTVITPTVSVVVEAHLNRHPGQRSYVELNRPFVAKPNESVRLPG